ncbi:MAG: type II CAAX endopeptidase family protein [Pseudomonadota bacterium]
MSTSFPLQGRYILALWLGPFFIVPPGIPFIFARFSEETPWFWYDITWYYYSYLFYALLFLVYGLVYKPEWRMIFKKPKLNDIPAALELTLFVVVFSMAAAFALFYPLSFILPEFVNYWYIDLPPFIYAWGESYPFLPNLLSFLSLVVLTPIVEELAFRGVLLHRWSFKFGTRKAVLWSSLIFGIAHPDPIGAFAFSVAMCFLYMKSGTLLVPILCHSITNLIAWLYSAGYFYVQGPFYEYTLKEFQSEWGLGMVWIVLSAAWVISYVKRPSTSHTLELPAIKFCGRSF